MANLNMPIPQPAYQRDEESRFRSQLTQALQSFAIPSKEAIVPGTPATISNQSWWISVNEGTQAVTFNYQDSAGVRHTLALGNYV